jgi:hypothetical protein
MAQESNRGENARQEAERKSHGRQQRPWWYDPAFIIGIALFFFGGPLNYFSANPRILYLGALGASILIFYGVHQYVSSVERAKRGTPPPPLDPAAMSGTLKPEPTVLFSSESSSHTALEIGDSGARLDWHGQQGSPAIRIGEDVLTVERLANGNVAVTTTVRDPSGKIIAEIVRNDWKLRPSLLWDRNFNASAVEVRGETGEVILQVRALPDRIQLQGIWHSATGRFFELVRSPDPNHAGGLAILRPEQRVRIKPLFRYPSDQHLGELSN